MKTYKYDILIFGGGPIGASTFYFLKDVNKKIALVRAEELKEDPEHIATYLYAGGSIRWYFEDDWISQATQETANFIKNLKDKIDLSLIEDNYVFLNRGIMVPSLNISGSKLINYFIEEGKKEGKDVSNNTFLKEIRKENNDYFFITDKGVFRTDKALLALGHSIRDFFSDSELGFKFIKRQLLVFDLKLSEEQKKFPHTVIRFKGGVVYVFVKIINGEYRFLLGQEDVIEENEEFYPDNYWQKLIDLGILEIFPFLKNANILNILWGFDAENKKLEVKNINDKILIAFCGSAVRSCVRIGRELKDMLIK